MFRWYALNAMSGKENKARRDLLQRAESLNLARKIRRVEIPAETVYSSKDGVRQEKLMRTLPGYMLVEMELDADTWDLVRGTPNLNFINASEHQEPVALSLFEVENLLGKTNGTGARASRVASSGYESGQEVKIISGPMTDWNGTVTEVDESTRRLKILVSIFGRETPVEVAYEQVSNP
jgi:transcriptional antiterminator NusG